MAKKDPKNTRKVCFRLRMIQDSPYAEFGMIINHIRQGYKLYNGEVYELPEYVIDYIHSFKIEEVYTDSAGEEHVVVIQKYVCEPVNDVGSE